MSQSGGAHPYLEVGSLVAWHTRLEEAAALAASTHRRVLVIHGRATCGGTRALVEKTIAKEEIAEFLNAHFVGLASDADAPEEAVAALIARLPRQSPTPLCIYLDPDGRVVHSTAGGRPPAVFLNDLTDAMMKPAAKK